MASFLTKFFGKTASEGAAFAIGAAVHQPLVPPIQFLINEAWSAAPTKPLGVGELAQGVASGQIPRDWATDEARNTGFDSNRFDHLVRAFDTGPGVAAAYDLWHRGILNVDGFRRALARESLEAEWIEALVAAKETLLSPAALAAMRQQGYIDAAYQHAEAAKQGVTAERADLMFEAAGLPPGYGELRDMLHRGIITEGEFRQAIREANTKVKYTDELLQLAQPILTPIQAATLRLKGWITDDQANAIGALSGFTPEMMERLFLMQGRPMAPGQMFTALARKTVGPGGGAFSKDDFLRAIKQSDIRPEYGEALYAIRHAYPPLFQISRLVQAGAIDAATAVDWAEKDRYAPEVVSALRAYWEGGAGPTTGGQVEKAKTQLWGTAHRSYLAGESNATEARAALTRIGVPAGERDAIMGLWQAERDLVRKQLTPTQIRKAFQKAVRNPATGAAWTRGDAIARLTGMGMSLDDANTFLDE